MKHFLFLFLFLFSKLIGTPFMQEKSISKDEMIVNKLLINIATTLQNKYKMHFIGEGASMMNEIEWLGLEFKIYYPLTQKEAREIFIDCTRLFLEEINSNTEIRQYLKHYPFTSKDIGISLHIYDDSKMKKLYHPQISLVDLSEGNLIYRTNDNENEYIYKSSYEETYEEALKLIQQENKCKEN